MIYFEVILDMEINAQKIKDDLIRWIRVWFEQNGENCNAVIGISGGKDSTIVAALCAEALGKERVTGVLMPNGTQSDISDSKSVVKHLGINSLEINIKEAYDSIISGTSKYIEPNLQTRVNLVPRLRMSALYAVSQSINGRVANTSNLSESWIGYSTRYGDGAGDFAPLLNLTVTECKAIGHALNIPPEFVDKVPHDGLGGQTDEEKIGFTYDVLDKYIRTGICENEEIKNKIDALHAKNKFKTLPMPRFEF
ncbi:MAG: NAD(+) synthase [Endomicrobia bacterium]|nr:NAD(+) synthase [Endomicrobiia bacterium]MCL2506176.1 NAD(+) synthase [Endomicrobiia bacterium]